MDLVLFAAVWILMLPTALHLFITGNIVDCALIVWASVIVYWMATFI